MSFANKATGGEVRISKRVEKELHQLKVVIRRLPPDFTEEKLLEKISPLPPHNFFYFAPGEPGLGPHGSARAYINFSDESDIIPFRDQFDGYVLTTERGQRYHAIVEYAPFQGVPKKLKRKPDSRCGTIEQDADYQAFMQSLETKTEALPSLELSSYMEEVAANRVQDVQKTPLIEYLEDKKAARAKKAAKNRIYVVESKKKRKGSSEPAGKSKFSRASGKSLESSKSLKDDTDSQKGRSEDLPPRDRKERREGQNPKGQRSGSAAEIGAATNHVPDGSSSKRQRGSWPRDVWGEGGRSYESRGRGARNYDDRRKGSAPTQSLERRPGGEKRGSYHAENSEERDRGRGRNKDRPDRALYAPRGRDREQGGGGRREPREREKPKEVYDHWPSRGEGSRGSEDQGRSKGRYYADKWDRSEGRDKDRSVDEREWGRKPWGDRDRFGGKGKDYQYSANYDRPKPSGQKGK